MACDTSEPVLPKLMGRRRGEKFSFGVDWSCHVTDPETVDTATVTVVRKPTDEADPITVSATLASNVATIDVGIAMEAMTNWYRKRRN